MDLYQQFIAKSRYSRYLDDKNRREHFHETVDRYLEFFDQHLQKNFDHKMPREELREALLNFDVMPSMRAMMTAGKALERDHTANFNCAYLPVDDPKAFDEALHILSCGTGVGFSVEHKYVDKLPEIPEKMFNSDTVIVVKDSKEGWAKALRQLIALLYSGEMPKYDVSQVRPKGARLKTFGGRASGPEPLCELFDYVINKFKCAAGRKLSSIECHDIMCKIAEVIVVGGVRRCLPEGTRVHTPEGFKAIETLKPGDRVNTPYGPRKVLNVFDQGEQETIILKHAFGEFECTPNHKMAVIQEGSLNYIFKKAKDLKLKDSLITTERWSERLLECSGDLSISKEKNLILFPTPVKQVHAGRVVHTWDIEVEDVHQFIAENLVTHNSALISLSDLEDDRMREAKSGSWWEHQGQRALANNSATYDRKPDMAQFLKEWTALFMSGSGERGLFSRYASKNIAAKSGRRSVSYEFGTNPCCFTGEMRLLTEGGYLPFSELVKHETVRIVNPNGAITEGKVWSSGIKPVVKVLLSTGKEISCTPDHVFRLANGAEKQAKDLVGETLDVYENFRFSAYRHGDIKGLSQEELSLIKELRLGGTLSGTSLIYQSLSETIIKEVSSVLSKLGIKSDHYKRGIVYELKVSDFDSLINLGDKIGLIFTDTANKVAESLKELAPSVVSVFEDGEQEVFDFTEPETHWGIVEGLVVHNSEIILRPNQFCNLTSIVARPGDTLEDLKRKARLATLLGTYQSTLTKFPYLRKMWKFNTEEERLLGVSLSGTCDHEILKNATEDSAEMLQKMKEVVIETNRELAKQLGIPQSTATTCVKPEGTASQLNDTASGIHTRYAQYYIRRVRNDKKDPLSAFLMAKGIPYEDDLFNPSTVIFSFPRKSPEGSLLRNDKTAVEQLKYWKHIQENWCEHKPSITVYIKEDEWMEVGAWVWENFDVLSGVSFLPYDGGTYKQAPYEEIDEETYNKLLAEMPEEINWDDLIENEDNVEGVQNLACVAGICEI